MDSRLPKLRGKGMESPVNFTNPSSGKRLGLFNRPKPGTKVMPPAKPTLAEVRPVRGRAQRRTLVHITLVNLEYSSPTL